MIAPKKWATDASDAVLIRMWTARYTSVAIGAVLGVTARQAANRAQRLRKQGRLAARRNGWYDKHSVAAVIDDGPWPDFSKHEIDRATDQRDAGGKNPLTYCHDAWVSPVGWMP